jgi:hypothetical protein
MSAKKNHTLTLALCISLMAHGLGLSALAWWVVLTTPPPKLAAIDREKLIITQIGREIAAIEKVKPPPPPPPPAPPPPEPKPRQKPRENFQKPQDHFKDDSGEHNGTGTANRSNKGDQPMQAHQGYEQADLMHPNAKKFDENSPAPASAGKPEDTIAGVKQPSRAGQIESESDKLVANTDNIAAHAAAVAMASDQGTRPVPKLEIGKPASAVPSGDPNSHAVRPIAKPPNPQASGLKELAGHKAEESDTDSMAFAKVPTTVFRNGKLEGRKGLKVTTKQVRFTAVSEREWFALGYPRTVFGVRVDDKGIPQNVIVLESSGSNYVDDDRKQSLYEWTLEPEKDKDGKVVDYLWTVAME